MMKALVLFFQKICLVVSVMQIALAPMALAKESENLTKVQMQNLIVQMGLDKKITVSEFFNKNKHLYPEHVQKQIENAIKSKPNFLMPQFEVVSSKNSEGKEVPVLRTQNNGKLLNIQWLNTDKVAFKFHNTDIDKIDILNFNDMFYKVLAGDASLKDGNSINSKNENNVIEIFSNKFVYPIVTKKQWFEMSEYEKASYTVNHRLLWSDARRVLDFYSKFGDQNSSSSIRYEQQYFNFSTLMALINKANALGCFSWDYTPIDGTPCVRGGYPSNWKKRSMFGDLYGGAGDCPVDAAKMSHPLQKEAHNFCSSQGAKLSCNPLIYGANEDGSPICFNSSNIYEHRPNSECERAGSLGSSGVSVVKSAESERSLRRYKEKHLNTDLKNVFNNEQKSDPSGAYIKTERLVTSLLRMSARKRAKDSLRDEERIKRASLNELLNDSSAYDELKKIQENFNSDIEKAKKACLDASKEWNNLCDNYDKSGCDQLHRRYVFVDELFETKCKPQGYDKDKKKCDCGVTVSDIDKRYYFPGTTYTCPVVDRCNVVAPVTRPADCPVIEIPCPPGVRLGGDPEGKCNKLVPAVVAPTRLDPESAACKKTPPDAGCPCANDATKLHPNCGTQAAVTIRDCAPGVTDAGCKCPNDPAKAYPNCGEQVIRPAGQQTDVNLNPRREEQLPWLDEYGRSIVRRGDSMGYNGRNESSNSFSNLFSNPTFTTLAAIGIAVGGMYLLSNWMSPDKNPQPKNMCPDGSAPPCKPVCVPPKVVVGSTCKCQTCPPGQIEKNCGCVKETVVPPTSYTCPDGITKVTDLNTCPKYSCWNGLSYANPMNCPVQGANSKSIKDLFKEPVKFGK